jgi:hypothetical protein
MSEFIVTLGVLASIIIVAIWLIVLFINIMTLTKKIKELEK